MLTLKIFETEPSLGDHAAEQVVEQLLRARDARGRMTLGCPSGRSPRSTYAGLARLAAARRLDLSTLHLLMMDEFVAPAPGGGWVKCPDDAHYSCTRFGEHEIRQAINGGIPPEFQIPPASLHTPDPNDPSAYEDLIDSLGGIDVFLLASGASDGHVAFNPPDTWPLEMTRVTRLADETRRDNLASFPAFKDIDAVPTWGVTVGPGTIARATRSAALILIGAEKAEAVRRIVGARHYEPDWPATIVHACADPVIMLDRSALDASGLAGAKRSAQ